MVNFHDAYRLLPQKTQTLFYSNRPVPRFLRLVSLRRLTGSTSVPLA